MAYLDHNLPNPSADAVDRADLLRRIEFKNVSVRRTRQIQRHNRKTLDAQLREMDVADRDLVWTETLRANKDAVLSFIADREKAWRTNGSQTSVSEQAYALECMWILTSTVRELRDRATRALYWFGRSDPAGLFDLVNSSLTIEDAYVGERTLAAAYGVVMARQLADPEFEQPLAVFLRGLGQAFSDNAATNATSHCLARSHAHGIFEFANRFYPEAVPKRFRGDLAFAPLTTPQPESCVDMRFDEIERAFPRHFHERASRRLFGYREWEGESDHRLEYIRDRAAAMVHGLGWRKADFGQIDGEIVAATSDEYLGEPLSVECYAEKYGWIAYCALASKFEGSDPRERPSRRFHAFEIDPSYPELPSKEPGTSTLRDRLLMPSEPLDELWIVAPGPDLNVAIANKRSIHGEEGPWIAVHGELGVRDRETRRRARIWIGALLVPAEDSRELVAELKSRPRPHLQKVVPRDSSTYAGEIPWSARFGNDPLAGTVGPRRYRRMRRTDVGFVDIEAVAHVLDGVHRDPSSKRHEGSACVPSRRFSERFDLRGVPQTFDQRLPDGELASISLGGINGLEGHILYVRADLLREFAGDRRIVWVAAGERFIFPPPRRSDPELDAVRDGGATAWIEVRTEPEIGL